MRYRATTTTATIVIALASLLLLLGGCGAAATDQERAYADEGGSSSESAYDDSSSSGSDSSGETSSSEPSESSESSDSDSTSESSESSSDESSEQEGSSPEENPEEGQLTAGEWRDLDNWDFWREMFGSDQSQQERESVDWTGFEELWSVYTRNRIGVRVVSGEKPVTDAKVELKSQEGEAIWTARTDNRGRAELFEGMRSNRTSSGALTVTAEAGGQEAVKHEIEHGGENRVVLEMDEAPAASGNLDVMFAVDTTGSMGDELSYLKAELEDVMTRSQEKTGQALDMRLSVNLYRDEGDSYVVKSNPFRSEVSDAVADLDSEGASGGGDFPEAVDQALADAIDQHQWRESATARLLFLVLDAPPHEAQQDLSRYRDAVKAAAEHGVRIIPVTGSGIDKKTEYLMRATGILTGGSYVFLTDHSGVGGDHIDPTIGNYDVQYLNDLLVDLISRFAEPVESVAPEGDQ